MASHFINMQTAAYNIIKEKILTTEYKPGEKVTEQLISQDINLGRTPVREAFIHLKNDGLITVLPQNGTYISKIDLQSAENARFVREHLEKELVAEAVVHNKELLSHELQRNLNLQRVYNDNHDVFNFLKMDDEFHQTFYKFAKKEQIWRWIQNINFHMTRFRYLRLTMPNLKWDNIIKQHTKIIELVETSTNSTALEKLVAEHLKLMLTEQESVIEVYPNYFDM